MIVLSLTELSIIGVYDRGIPNEERIVICVNETLNLGQFGIMLGIRSVGNGAIPIRDNLFWFGDGFVNKGDWLFVYTGPGNPSINPIPNVDNKMYTIHWGRNETILNHKDIVPMLFRVDAVQVPYEQPNLLSENTKD